MNNRITENKKNYLISICGKDKFDDIDDIDRLIKYVTREDGSSKAGANDVLYYGAKNIIDFLGTDYIIKQMRATHLFHTRKSKKKDI